MIDEFIPVTEGLEKLIERWTTIFSRLETDVISERRNIQKRTIKQIVGHMIDSASNNTHRIVHLQYQDSPLVFPNYATNGNNDRWIAIQNYQDENWQNMIQLWKFIHLHFVHVIKNINPDKLNNEWLTGSGDQKETLGEMAIDFLRHFKLHITEIDELIELPQAPK